ncbi:radical SAM family heme chaperone HemW [Arthrobacter sp. H14-L1]|uniref:radical SAM family heme chaperone HemW n=1 Tax=Arthrobacter sp. H14-L1 TaxID=2996697 RepID=UPI00226E0D26|nr:radical SAM family heme chaperone HemW [Arthrobacter sp. H14-L1]MCY0903739.1 radical SAM family heme chaperone HemW [Arthrobacter sp. H14-L1]
MPSTLPLGDPAPGDGVLPGQAADGAAGRGFSLYAHIPFCAVRCGYCDFNTYTATELGGGASQDAYAATAASEVTFAARAMQESGLPERKLATVFFGGGTPTLLPARDLVSVLRSATDAWGVSQDAEITTEANPDSVSQDSLRELADGGFTRVSFGMQSAVPHVLRVLDRTHDPARVPQAIEWARTAGLKVSVDLIYGTPGESELDWATSVRTALSYQPDHISAYSLIVEDGTKLAAQIRRGQVPGIEDDDHAAKYTLADALFQAAGLAWYEVSNWARTPEDACRHNLAYWHGDDWWGIGPGAHSHIGGVRWWNVKHPTAYAGRLARGQSPAAGRETLNAETREMERIMLLTRLSGGIQVDSLSAGARHAMAQLIADELIDARAAFAGRLQLTLRGRLLADAVVRRLLPD